MGSFTTPAYTGAYSSYNTLQSQPGHFSHRYISPPARPQYASLRRGVYPSSSLDPSQPNVRRTKLPSISPTYPTGVSTGSSVVSSTELNHSVTTSDTSDISSERDRESEV